MFKDSLNELSRRVGLIERNVVGDSIEIAKSGFGPNQLSHRAIRFRASR